MSDQDARPPEQKRLDELERQRTAARHRRDQSAAPGTDDADVYELQHHHNGAPHAD